MQRASDSIMDGSGNRRQAVNLPFAAKQSEEGKNQGLFEVHCLSVGHVYMGVIRQLCTEAFNKKRITGTSASDQELAV